MVKVVSVHLRLLECVDTTDRRVESVLREATLQLGIDYTEYRDAFFEARPDHCEDSSYITRGMLLRLLIAQLLNLRHLRILGPGFDSVEIDSVRIPLFAWRLLGITKLSLRTVDFSPS